MISSQKMIQNAKMPEKNAYPLLDFFLFAAYIIFLVSIVFSLRAVSSISIGLVLLIGLLKNRKIENYFPGNNNMFFFLAGCVLLFFVQCLSLLYTNNTAEGLNLLQRSTGLVVLPLAVFLSSNFFTRDRFRKLIFCFAAILSIASLYCIGFALFKYSTGGSNKVFFYHDLVKPLSQHAIQFSILVFSVLIYLIENLRETKKLVYSTFSSMIVLLSFFLVLLASKLIIVFYILYLLRFFFNRQINKKRGRIFVVCFIAILAAILMTANPVNNRFREIFTGNSVLFENKEFNPGVYFNGVQFRLVQWRFTYEILNEQNAWITGVTPGDAQSFLNKKYIDTKMYTGVAGTKDHGFLGYHTHNQFLQVSLENGLPALVIFLFICYSLLKMARSSKEHELKWLIVLLLVYCFTDAPLQTQYGLVIFTFLPALFYCGKECVKQIPSPAKNTKMSEPNYAFGDISFQRQPN